jgi:hypothetical protein
VSVTFDTTSRAAYEAATTATAKAAAVVSSLTGTVYVKVYNASNTVVGDGTMDSPWATSSGDTVTIGEVTEFEVTTTGTPDSGWYIRFENSDASRWVRASFGLAASSQDFKWSLSNWEDGQTGTIGTATIICPGNEAPVFTLAPVASSIPSSGGTIQFTATDPDGGALTYSLTTTRSGITINASTGLVTVTSAANGTSGNIVVQVSDGILTASATCSVTVGSEGDLKWYPGHYATPDARLTPSKLSQFQPIWDDIEDVANFVGGAVLVAWGQVETSEGVYDWSAVDAQRDALASIGKKLALAVKFENYVTSALPSVAANDANVDRIFPSYAITAGHVVAARTAAGAYKRQELKYWNAAAVDRMLAFITALAAKYDNDDVFALFATPETSITLDELDGTSTWANATTQFQRILAHCATQFSRTPAVMLNNFLNTQSATTSFQQAIVDAGVGCGGPDLFIPSLESNDNWGMRALRGERWNGSAWVTGVAEDQSYKCAVSVDQQVIRSTSATPALYYDAARNRYDSTHLIWWAKTTAYQYGNPSVLIPAMDWSNVQAYIRDNSVPLRTAVPTGLA